MSTWSPLNTKLVVEVHDDEIRAAKTEVLRMAADEFRRAAATGQDSETNLLAAYLLEQRAARITAGEDDHSRVSVEDLHAQARLERRLPDEDETAS